MAVNKDRKLDVAMDEETLKRAEEMCSGLSLEVSIEKRGNLKSYSGTLDDLNSMGQSAHPAVVIEVPDEHWLTLVIRARLPECSHALLVYRLLDGSSRKLVGRHEAARSGLRNEDAEGVFFCRFFPDLKLGEVE